jgi:pimeloyl-ACP methyl ester carboxylesterase
MVAGHRVHYFVEGRAEGQAVVFVHGLGGRAEDWRDLAPAVAEGGFRVFLPDLPGFGQSEQPTDFSYSVRDEAEAVVGFMDALGIHDADLGGWSMGGGIAQNLAARHPERVRKLLLFDSEGIYEKPKWDVNLTRPKSSGVAPYIARDILRRSEENAWVIHRAIDNTGNNTNDEQLSSLKMPVLIIWGELDSITPLSEGKRISELIPQSQMEVFPGCGHLAPTQCANDIGPVVVEFLVS